MNKLKVSLVFLSVLGANSMGVRAWGAGPNEKAAREIEVAEAPHPPNKKCDFIASFEFDAISGDADQKAKELIEKKEGHAHSNGEATNYLVKLGSKLKHGWLFGETITHHYAAYHCSEPQNK